jgi:hypothetical protein
VQAEQKIAEEAIADIDQPLDLPNPLLHTESFMISFSDFIEMPQD